MIYSVTTKDRIKTIVKSIFTVIKDEQFDVYRLEDENTVLIQLHFSKVHLPINDLLQMGIMIYNPNITAKSEDHTLITFIINK
jgi:hypothetical protein